MINKLIYAPLLFVLTIYALSNQGYPIDDQNEDLDLEALTENVISWNKEAKKSEENLATVYSKWRSGLMEYASKKGNGRYRISIAKSTKQNHIKKLVPEIEINQKKVTLPQLALKISDFEKEKSPPMKINRVFVDDNRQDFEYFTQTSYDVPEIIDPFSSGKILQKKNSR
ncbi:MAG: hypothetical protein HQK50_14070 [Oligoflexia bacterium]|nr:hypothetical protein [Oligoflexia bacterium]